MPFYILLHTTLPLPQVTHPRLHVDSTGEWLLLQKKNKYHNTPTFGLKCSIATVFECNKPQNGCPGIKPEFYVVESKCSLPFACFQYKHIGICRSAICLKHSRTGKEKSVSHLLRTKKPNLILKQKELSLSF